MNRNDPFSDPEALVRRVYAYVAYRLDSSADAEDVTNDVFERALRYRDSYDRTKGRPIEWLIGIARYRLAELHGQRSHEYSDDPIDVPDPVDLETEAVRRLTLREALVTLDQRDRELVALRYGADMSARQVADLLGMKVNGVEVALHRALKRLRTSFEMDQTPDSSSLPRASAKQWSPSR